LPPPKLPGTHLRENAVGKTNGSRTTKCSLTHDSIPARNSSSSVQKICCRFSRDPRVLAPPLNASTGPVLLVQGFHFGRQLYRVGPNWNEVASYFPGLGYDFDREAQ
jgi:hypothetical protein